MLVLGLITVLTAVALPPILSSTDGLLRTAGLAMLASAWVALNGLDVATEGGVSAYSGLLQVSAVSQAADALMLVVGTMCLTLWARRGPYQSRVAYPCHPEQAVMVLFTSVGSTLLVSSGDLVTLYLALELQSFAVYVLSALYRDSESATAAGLKYYLLGGLSSSLLLLGAGLVYAATGLTSLEQLYALVSVGTDPISSQLAVGLTLLAVGLLFKIASAPFHNWAPDVYDGVPTVITAWVAVLPKVSVLVVLLDLEVGLGGRLTLAVGNALYDSWTTLLLLCSLLSLLIGTVVGLAQGRIKRLLAYSTVSHVGFMLLALAVNSEEAIEAYLLYVLQYTATALNAFMVLLAFGYTTARQDSSQSALSDVTFIAELGGRMRVTPALGAAMTICLFSMAGVPPLVGFVAKASVLSAALHAGYTFMALVAVVASVISGAYYLTVVRVMAFEPLPPLREYMSWPVSSLLSFNISWLTLATALVMAQPALVLDSLSLLALTIAGS